MKMNFLALMATVFLSNNLQASAGIDTSDLDQVEVFRRLYNHAGSPNSAMFGFVQDPKDLDHGAAAALFSESVKIGEKIDYLNGRYMKVTFQAGSIETSQYDSCSAKKACDIVAELRAEKTTSEGSK